MRKSERRAVKVLVIDIGGAHVKIAVEVNRSTSFRMKKARTGMSTITHPRRATSAPTSWPAGRSRRSLPCGSAPAGRSRGSAATPIPRARRDRRRSLRSGSAWTFPAASAPDPGPRSPGVARPRFRPAKDREDHQVHHRDRQRPAVSHPLLHEPNQGKQQVHEEQGQRDEEEHPPHDIAQSERGEENQNGPCDSRRARVEAEPATLEH
jgi:hypothetical protein